MTAAVCVFCSDGPQARRGACWHCYRNLSSHVELLPPRTGGPPRMEPHERLRRWAAALAPVARARLLEALTAPIPATPPSPAPRRVRRNG